MPGKLVRLREHNRLLMTLCGLRHHLDVVERIECIQRHIRDYLVQNRLMRTRRLWIRIQSRVRGKQVRESIVGQRVRLAITVLRITALEGLIKRMLVCVSNLHYSDTSSLRKQPLETQCYKSDQCPF